MLYAGSKFYCTFFCDAHLFQWVSPVGLTQIQHDCSFLQPSHSDKAANPEVLKWTNDLAKFRKQLKGEQPPLGNWTLPHLNLMLGSDPVTVTF